MQIRSERLADAVAIRAVTSAAFKDIPYGSGSEAAIVDVLRHEGALTISLVAVDSDDDIVGHVAFSPVTISKGYQSWYGLGPVSVRPDRQREGIGGNLIRAGLDRLDSMEAAGCVVLGDPNYYGRFGFASDPVLYSGGAPARYFQRLVLRGRPPSGEVEYHPAFKN